MKNRWIWVAAAVLVVLTLISVSDRKRSAINHVLRNEEQITEHANRCMEKPEEAVRYRSWNTRYNQRFDVVQFQVSYIGFGSESDEKGIYYSPSDVPVDLGNDIGTEQETQGSKYIGDGDNYTYVEKITDHWYWYEIHW